MKSFFKFLAFITLTFTPWLFINVVSGFAAMTMVMALLPTAILAVPTAMVFYPEKTEG